MAYTLVAICILVLHYKDDEESYANKVPTTQQQIVRQIFNLNFVKQPNSLSSNITKMAVVVFSVLTTIFCLVFGQDDWFEYLSIRVILILLVVLLLAMFVVIARQPKAKFESSFKVPLVPFLPLLSIFMNLYLMFQLDVHTWIRFGVWMIIGYLIYFTYGIKQSVEGNREKLELSEHGQKAKNAFDGKCIARPVNAHTMQSIDDLHNANIEFTTGSTVQLSHQWYEKWDESQTETNFF